MTVSRVQMIQERCEKATEGPWLPSGTKRPGVISMAAKDRYGLPLLIDKPTEFADADFIAHAREDVPWLLGELERLQKEHALIRSYLRDAIAWIDPAGASDYRLWQAALDGAADE